MHVCVLCLEGTGLGMVIPEVPPGSTEPVPPELLGLGFWGACVGRRVCACLVRALVCTVGVFLLQTVPQDLRPGEGRGASPEGCTDALEAPLPTWQRSGLALGTAPPCGAARWASWHPREADDLPGKDEM